LFLGEVVVAAWLKLSLCSVCAGMPKVYFVTLDEIWHHSCFQFSSICFSTRDSL